jgi:hypothetical protein
LILNRLQALRTDEWPIDCRWIADERSRRPRLDRIGAEGNSELAQKPLLVATVPIREARAVT